MRTIDADNLLAEIAKLKKSPWFMSGYKQDLRHAEYLVRKEAVEIVEDLCIKTEPTIAPEPIHGKKVKIMDFKDSNSEHWHMECSICGQTICWKEEDCYCEYCGAKLEGFEIKE